MGQNEQGPKVLLIVHRPGLEGIGQDSFVRQMAFVGVDILDDAESIAERNDVCRAFGSYGLDACVMEGRVHGNVDPRVLKARIQLMFGFSMRPIIFMYICDREEKE